MCGLAGFLSPQGFHQDEAVTVVTRMRETLAHRGPDDAGSWLDGEAGIALAHRRLSILDLSPAGHQPMQSVSGRFVLVFNGEVYNHLEIRRKLAEAGRGPASWRGHSDTETLLAAIEQWGLEQTLRQCVGMFALALWDRQERALALARDRMGEKPLFYGWQGDVLLFGSELKALRAHPKFRSEIEGNALPAYLRHGYIPAPWSIWRGIFKLTPGCVVHFKGYDLGTLTEPKPYWSLADAIAAGKADPFQGSDKDAIDALERQLQVAIAGQMVADVPLGAFLSGGIDSSTVVALMQARSRRPVKTFTIGFREAGYNEAEHARAVAKHLGTEHTELYVDAAQARSVIPELTCMYDEPFGDSSAIPTHLVSQLARQHVAVSLSGDGGDELFGGYNRYFNLKGERIWRAARSMPEPFRALAVSLVRYGSFHALDEALKVINSALRRPVGRSLGARANLFADLANCLNREDLYIAMTSQWHQPPVASLVESSDWRRPAQPLDLLSNPVEHMMLTDSLTYLPDDILTKVDRAAMAVSLETRVPILDHRVVELAWRLPYEKKVRDGEGKWLLRQVLYRHVPREIVDRPKMGFGVPIGEWLRGPLRDWAEDLLDESKLTSQGLFDPKPIRARWKQHVAGQHNWRDSLWLVLMFQAWHRKAKEVN
jgi:asparagine synthase (glutamine-hydrolysing)